MAKRLKLVYQPLDEIPAEQRVAAARELVARDPHMPAYERRELLERAMYPKPGKGGWVESEPTA